MVTKTTTASVGVYHGGGGVYWWLFVAAAAALFLVESVEAAFVKVDQILDPMNAMDGISPDDDIISELMGDEHTFLDYGFVKGAAEMDLSELTFNVIAPRQNESVMDVVLAQMTGSCAEGFAGNCDWSTLGIGPHAPSYNEHNRNDELFLNTIKCCDDFAIQNGFCTNETLGRLILNEKLFRGYHWNLTVSPSGRVDPTRLAEHVTDLPTGTYIFMIEHCNPYGPVVELGGVLEWKSSYGYLPSYIYPSLVFAPILLAAYLVLLGWFSCQMVIHAESRIPLEKWILCTIVWSFCECLFVYVDLVVYNEGGQRNQFLFIIATLAGDIKHAVSRCLFVMVALGWGVTHDSLGACNHCLVWTLGILYVVASFILDMLLDYSSSNGADVAFLLLICFMTVFVVNFMFYYWIPTALCRTMTQLKETNQTNKLERFRSLLHLWAGVILLSILMWIVLANETMPNKDTGTANWSGVFAFEVINISTEVLYYLVLLGVAILWRPNPNAREFAYVMELSTMDDECDYELELAETTQIPEARAEIIGSAQPMESPADDLPVNQGEST